MAGSDSSRGAYGQLEDAYYSFLDKIEGAGIPVYKAVDAIEGANIPSFPLAIILLLAAIGGAAWLVTGSGALSGNSSLTVTVQDTDSAAVAGAAVSASLDGKELASGLSGNDGKVKLAVPTEKSVSITAEKAGYAKASKDFTASEPEESVSITLAKPETTITKTINVKASGTGTLISDSTVMLRFACTGTDYTTTQSPVSGQVDLTLPADCDSLNVTPAGDFRISGGLISLSSDDSFDISVEKGAAAQGTAIVSVKDATGQPISGLDVSLYSPTQDNKPGTRYASSQTSSAGTASFTPVPGRYYAFISDALGNYAEYDGLGADTVQEVRANQTTQFAAVMAKSTAGRIRIALKDKDTKEAIAGASAKFFKGQAEVTTLKTDEAGQLEFRAGEDVLYSVTIDKAGYLIKSASVSPSVEIQEIAIEQATAENSQTLLVVAVDESDKPLEGVRLRLKSNSDASQAGEEIATGLDGRALFGRIADGLYYVYAVKPGYGEKTSDTISVSARQQNSVRIKIPIGTGAIDALVVDADGNPISGAQIKAVDASSAQVLQDVTAGSDGKKALQARADKKVFLVAGAEGYLPTTTAPMQMQKGVTINRKVQLVKSAQAFSVELAGLYAGEEAVSDSQESGLNPGQKYTAKLRVMIPKGAAFDEAGLHIRTGREQNNSIDKDLLYITEMRAAAAITGATTYTPSTGQSNDFQHISSGNVKWSNAVFRKAQGGIYEAEADIQVREDARIGSQLELWYRAYGRSGGYLRAPVDSSLGTSESTGQKQGLYANALKRTFSVGPASLCGDDFCATYSMLDLRSNLTTGIAESHSAQVGNSYRLSFEISGLSKTPFSDSQLSIKDSTSRIAIDSYTITTALGDQRTGQRSGSEISAAVGDIGRDSVVKGEATFTPKSDGTIPIAVSILSGTTSTTEVYRKNIYLRVQPAETLSLEILPKAIVPLIANNILVKVTDGNGQSAVSNAKVNIKKDGQVLATGETDSDGVFAYTLQSPAEGSTIGIEAIKSGFAVSEREIKVSGNVLLPEPSSLRESITVGGTEYKTIDAKVSNFSQVPLTVEKVSPGKEFEGFIDFGFTEPTAGTLVGPDGNIGLSASIKLGRKGAGIIQPTTIKGTITVVLSNPNFQQKWSASIPAEISIGFGGEVDDTACLDISPLEWKAVGHTTESKKLSAVLGNKCAVSNEPVQLKSLMARFVPGNEGNAGTIKASTTAGGQAVQLDKSFRKLADTLEPGADETIALEFKPDNIVSGKMEGKIEIQASHFTASGEQKLVKRIDTAISVNNLAQCVEVLTNQDITVESCPFGLGYGNYGGGAFSSYSNSRYGAFDPYTSRYGYGQGSPPYIGSAYPQSGLPGSNYYNYGSPGYMGSYSNSYYPNTYNSQPFYGGLAQGVNPNPGISMQWACNYGAFQVKNSCSSPVTLTFDPQPGVSVKQKSMRIEPGAQGEVGVEPTNFFGRYAIGIKASTAEQGAVTSDLKPVFVNVTSELAKNYKDCISVSPARTIQFNNFINKPVVLDVTNSCYGQGVFLEASNGTINFTDSINVNPGDPFGSANSGLFNYPPTWMGSQYGAGGIQGAGSAFPSGVNPSYPTIPNPPSQPLRGATAPGAAVRPVGPEARQMVQSWAQIDEIVRPAANGKITQVVKFELVKNLGEYQNRAPEAKFFEANPFADIGNLRYFLTQGYYTVNGRTNLVVRFSTPNGGLRVTSFPMVIQDFWPLLEFAQRISEKFTTYGNPTKRPAECLNMQALNFSKLGPLPVDKAGGYSTTENGNLFIINDATGCGSVDHLNDQLNPAVFQKNGLVMKLTHDGHEAKITFDTKNWNGLETDFTNAQGITTLTRVSPPQTQLVSLSTSFRARAGEGKQPGQTGPGTTTPGTTTPGAQGALFCSGIQGAETGAAAFTKYGFQHFKLDWRVPSASEPSIGISRNACDALEKDGVTERPLRPSAGTEAPLFCDGTQTLISFTQKAAEIKALTDVIVGMNNKGVGYCLNSGTFDCEDASNQTTKNIYKYAMLQRSVPAGHSYFIDASATNDDVVVDIGKADMENKEFASVKDKIKRLSDAPIDADLAGQIRADTAEIIKALQEATGKNGGNLRGTHAVMELRGWNNPKTPDTISRTGSIYSADKLGSNWYVFSVESYSNFRQLIIDKCITPVPQPAQCDIGEPGSPEIITTEFLKEIAKGNWKLTANILGAAGSVDGHSPLVKRLIMTKAKLGSRFSGLIGTGKPYANLYEFYRQNIAPKAYLTADNYTDDLAKQFREAEAYKSWEPVTKLKDTPIMKFFNGDRANMDDTQATAGDYNALLDYSWGEPSEGFTVVRWKDRDLAAIDRANSAKGLQSSYAKNALFSTPLNGPVGTPPAAQNREFMYFNSYNRLDDPNFNPTAANTGGLKGYTFLRGYSDTKPGRVLSLSASGIEYSPSDPITLQAYIVKQRESAAGALFRFTSSDTGGNAAEQQLGATLSSDAGDAQQTMPYDGTLICSPDNPDKNKKYEGIVLQSADATTRTYKGVVFLPTRTAASQTTATSRLTLACLRESGTRITASYKLDPSVSAQAASSQNSVLELNSGVGTHYQDKYTLKSLLQYLNQNATCMKAADDGSSLDIYWNAEYFTK